MYFASVLLSAALASLSLVSTSTMATEARPTMSLAEVITGVSPLVPGSSENVEGFFQAQSVVAKMDRFGWHHPPIDYRTRDGILLHIQLTSDWPNTKTPDVFRLSAAVDERQCIDAALLRDELQRDEHIDWVSLGTDHGWSATYKGKFMTISQRQGHCLAAVIVDNRRQPRVAPPVRPYKVDPSGRLNQIPLPGH